MTKTKLKPVIAERADGAVLIQIQEKRRKAGAKGTLAFKRSKSITVYNLSLDEVHERIMKALRE